MVNDLRSSVNNHALHPGHTKKYFNNDIKMINYVKRCTHANERL